jgi:hypothetical protein
MKPPPTFSVGVRLWPLMHAHLGSFFWNLRTSNIKTWGPSGAVARQQGFREGCLGHKGPAHKRPRCIGAETPRTHLPIYLSIYLSKDTCFDFQEVIIRPFSERKM